MRLYHQFVFSVIVTIVTVGLSTPTFAQECVSLSVVGSQDTEVTQRVYSEGSFIPGVSGQNNANWSVPQDQHFNKFLFTLIPQSNGSFDITIAFEYSDDSLDERFEEENKPLSAGEPFEILVDTVDDKQPVQVQMYIGGQEAVGREYTVSAKGCL